MSLCQCQTAQGNQCSRGAKYPIDNPKFCKQHFENCKKIFKIPIKTKQEIEKLKKQQAQKTEKQKAEKLKKQQEQQAQKAEKQKAEKQKAEKQKAEKLKKQQQEAEKAKKKVTDCDKLGGLLNKASSCYVDSALMVLFYADNQFVNQYLLEADISTLNLTKNTVNAQGKIIKTMIPLADLQLYKLVKQIQKDLMLIKTQLVSGSKGTCSLFRHHLQQYIEMYNESDLGSKLKEFNWETAQQEPRDLLIRLFDIFGVPDLAKVRYTTYVTDVVDKCSGPDLIKVTDQTRQENININIDIGEISDISISPTTGDIDYVIKDKPLQLSSFINRSQCVKFTKPSDYFKFHQKAYPMYIKHTQYLEAPLIWFHVDRKAPTGKLTTPIIPFQILKLGDDGQELHLMGIIVHLGGGEGGHYMSYINCGGVWYFYNDLIKDKPFKAIGTYEDMLKDESGGVTVITDSTDYFFM